MSEDDNAAVVSLHDCTPVPTAVYVQSALTTHGLRRRKRKRSWTGCAIEAPSAEDFFYVQDIVNMVAEALYAIKRHPVFTPKNGTRPDEPHYDRTIHGLEARYELMNFRCVSQTFARAGVRPLFREIFLYGIEQGPTMASVRQLQAFGQTDLAKYTRHLVIQDWKTLSSHFHICRRMQQEDEEYDFCAGILDAVSLPSILGAALRSFNRLDWITLVHTYCEGYTELFNIIEELGGSGVKTLEIDGGGLWLDGEESFLVCNPRALRNLRTLRFMDWPSCQRGLIRVPDFVAASLQRYELVGRADTNWVKHKPMMPNCNNLQSLRLTVVGVSGRCLARLVVRDRGSLQDVRFQDVYLVSGNWCTVINELLPLLPQLRSLHLCRISYLSAGVDVGRCEMAPEELENYRNSLLQCLNRDAKAWQTLLDTAAPRDLAHPLQLAVGNRHNESPETSLRIGVICPRIKDGDSSIICGETIFYWTNKEGFIDEYEDICDLKRKPCLQ